MLAPLGVGEMVGEEYDAEKRGGSEDRDGKVDGGGSAKKAGVENYVAMGFDAV